MKPVSVLHLEVMRTETRRLTKTSYNPVPAIYASRFKHGGYGQFLFLLFKSNALHWSTVLRLPQQFFHRLQECKETDVLNRRLYNRHRRARHNYY